MDFISDDFYTYDQFAVKANTHIYNTCNEPRHAILFSQGKLEKSYRIFLSGFFTNNLFFEDVKINKTCTKVKFILHACKEQYSTHDILEEVFSGELTYFEGEWDMMLRKLTQRIHTKNGTNI